MRVGRNSSCGRRLPRPFFVKRKAREDQEQANGGAAGAVDPDIYGEREGTSDEQGRDPGVAPATVRAWQIGFGLAHAKHCDHRRAVKYPSGKNKKIGELFEG